jgi:hypothetical protein
MWLVHSGIELNDHRIIKDGKLVIVTRQGTMGYAAKFKVWVDLNPQRLACRPFEIWIAKGAG